MGEDQIMNELVNKIESKEYDKKFINKLDDIKDKVKYLRMVKHYTQKETAQMISRSERHVRRIESKLKSVL